MSRSASFLAGRRSEAFRQDRGSLFSFKKLAAVQKGACTTQHVALSTLCGRHAWKTACSAMFVPAFDVSMHFSQHPFPYFYKRTDLVSEFDSLQVNTASSFSMLRQSNKRPVEVETMLYGLVFWFHCDPFDATMVERSHPPHS